MRQRIVITTVAVFAVTVGLGIVLAAIQHPVNPAVPQETATFAGGCFWGLEAAFRRMPGVTGTVVGYTGGASENPTYEDVSSRRVDHLEACRVTYDPAKVSYQQLVAHFLEMHDGTLVDRKSPYLGSPTRLVVFFRTPEEKKIAETGKAKFPQSDIAHHSPLVQVLSEGKFYHAEEDQQRYLEKHGLASCRIGL